MRRFIIALSVAVAASAMAFAIAAQPASAAPNCGQTPIPPICLHETPTPTPTPRVSISTTRVSGGYPSPFLNIDVTYSSTNATRTVLEKCNAAFGEDDPLVCTAADGWTVVSSETGGATKTYVDTDENLYFEYQYQVLAYDASGHVVASEIANG